MDMIFRNLMLVSSFALLPMAVQAADLDEARVKELVYEAIRENPQIIMEAVEILQRQDAEAQAQAQATVLRDQRQLLEQDPNAPVLGNPDGDVTVIEFFDYNCPYCRRAMPEVLALLEADPNVRLVYREWPILGDGSVFATKAALASRLQGKYEAFHWALMGMNGRAEEASVLRIAQEVGLDIERLQTDMERPEIEEHIATSMRLTQSLGFSGTPSFVIGDNLVPGFVESDKLTELVDNVRASAN
ncbi:MULTISPECIES: DsbA family protein [Rhodobacterales]|jgi:protein-disulfide isomerase|uniref:DSBA oxidoreductase n=8 Tax=Rhodobacterales TaxID=204455 RepID=A0A0B5E2E1_9RHOB|nr:MULTISPECIES: DsbA family protein [Rhodobacterales]MBD3623842.1 DsbA family protein [Paracoccaceae bacterium]NDW58731.1 DsbA family protein [Salipiger sp. PrR004]AJE49449.1 DSBA oxidoreductase [Celeribacter indicus]KFE34365.1 DSBA oxidoreductase [Thioclava atlantica]MBN9890521.1 thioredoxin domain-containing protein [Salipiger abyssi]|tara:strand:- start:5137 stop:5871 length:735 start_codon:yes stop_codon:yes gene_type:complete